MLVLSSAAGPGRPAQQGFAEQTGLIATAGPRRPAQQGFARETGPDRDRSRLFLKGTASENEFPLALPSPVSANL